MDYLIMYFYYKSNNFVSQNNIFVFQSQYDAITWLGTF